MIRSALALLSTLEIGTRVKQSFERSLRQVIGIAIAAVFSRCSDWVRPTGGPSCPCRGFITSMRPRRRASLPPAFC
jgi:hypothetical protein